MLLWEIKIIILIIIIDKNVKKIKKYYLIKKYK